MKTTPTKWIPFLFILFLLLASCEEAKDSIEDELEGSVTEKLYVKFTNNTDSEYTISSIHILNMGMAGTLDEPTGVFSDNVLADGETIAPGEFVFFYLEIPNLHYAYCRLGIINDQEIPILMYDQAGYSSSYEGTFTHWGSDEREVSTSITYNDYSNFIQIRSWSEWAGIE